MQEIVAAVLVRSGRALLGHRHPDRASYPDCWDVIGGHVEAGETPAGALVRELDEELGIRVDSDALGQPFRTATVGPKLQLDVWVITEWTGEVMNQAPEEHDRLGWFSAAELSQLAWSDPEIERLVGDALAALGR